MAGRKDNIKALFSNTRTRIIILFTVILLIIAILIGVIRFSAHTSADLGSASLTNAPGIQSVPGSTDPTAQYAALQESQNVQQAQQASKTGDSAIPTIIRTQAFGQGVDSVGPQHGEGGVGFSTLAMEDTSGPQKSLWMQTLKDSNCSKASVDQVVTQGATLTDLKGACSCLQLKDNGYKLNDLVSVCSCTELKASGFNARQFKEIGWDAGRLRACGFDACELRNAGFAAQQMKEGGYSDGELKGAGFGDQEINRAGGLPDGITANDVRKAGCDPDALARLKAAGVSAAAIRNSSGCSAAQLKAAGFIAQDLNNAGFSAADLKNAGFSPDDLRQAGYSARDLLDAGYSPAQLAAGGYSSSDIKAAEAELPPGMTADDVKNAGCDVQALIRERQAGVSAAAIRRYAGCSAAALKEAGFTNDDLGNAGFTPAQINAAALDDNTVKAAGCDPNKLRSLLQQGVSAKRIHDLNGCSADALKAAGFDPKALADAGFTPQQLMAAGFTPDQIRAAEGASDALIKSAGCDPTKLKQLFAQGVSAKRIRDLNGCSAAALKAAGYSAGDLANAGFTPADLLDVGYTPQQLKLAGVTPSGIIASGRTANCSVDSLKAARASGVSAATIRQTLGCSAAALKAAGYSAADLRNAGFTAAELKAAGFSAPQLKDAGFSAGDLRASGFNAQDLKNAGFSAAQLKDAGYNAADLKNAQFTPDQLKAAGYTAKDLKNAGFTAADLKRAGYSAKDLKDGGYKAADLRDAGYSPQELQDAGFTTAESNVAGLDPVAVSTDPSTVTPIPAIPGVARTGDPITAANNTQRLEQILNKQQTQLSDQRYQQKIQDRANSMLGAANQALSTWREVNAQVYVEGNVAAVVPATAEGAAVAAISQQPVAVGAPPAGPASVNPKALVKTGDILFAVLDTSVNSDEPGPILATIVSGRFRGAKLIGSFTLPANAEKMVISFNTMSVPTAPKSTSISAYAIDPNTARTALASYTNHHYLLRYGSLFAATFLEGFGNAIQSANTTITIGGTGGVQTTQISTGAGRSLLENAVIGLATVGKQWGQVAQVQFNRPTTVQLCAGTPLGILFTQDLVSL